MIDAFMLMMLEKILPYVFAAGVIAFCCVGFYAAIWDYRIERMERKKRKRHV